MNVKVSFHHVDHSDALEHFVREKSSKLAKFLGDSERLEWVVEFKDRVFNPHLKMSLKGRLISVNSKAENAFVAVNEVLAKAFHLLSKRHGRRVNFH
jgi:ribosomal subunit interface protein